MSAGLRLCRLGFIKTLRYISPLKLKKKSNKKGKGQMQVFLLMKRALVNLKRVEFLCDLY